jgi:predicted PurR-regulated permease PerM
LKFFDRKTAQALFTALVFALVLLFLYAAWRAIIAFLFAIFFAYLLEAPVSYFEKLLRGSRGAAIAAVYAIVIAGLVVLFFLVGSNAIGQAQTLARQAPELGTRLKSGVLVQQIAERRGWSQNTAQTIQGYINEHAGDLGAEAQALVLRGVKSVENNWWLILVPILAIFFLKDGRKFANTVICAVEDIENRKVVATVVEEMNMMVGHFIRAQLILAALAMVVITLFLWAARVPYALPLGLAAGALEFIPVAGPVIGGLAVTVVALLAGYGHVIWIIIFLLFWRGIQDYVTSPRILGTTLELHPLLVLFGVFAGGEVAGVIGVFLSIPVLAALRILWRAGQLMYKRNRQVEVVV